MQTWASYAEQGRKALLAADYGTLDRLIDANFDLRTQLYQISEGNLEMIRTARQGRRVGEFRRFRRSDHRYLSRRQMYSEITEAMANSM